MDIEIKLTNDVTSKMKVSQKVAEIHNLMYLKETIIRFGFATAEIQLVIDDQLADKEIILSTNIVNKLCLPSFCNFNITVENNVIVIGPFVGIVVGEKKQTLPSKIRLLNNYVNHYSKINGVVFGFTLGGINKKNLMIEGLIFNPVENLWENTVLPFPASILKRGFVNQDWREYLHSLYGSKFFNYKTINKWQMHNRLSVFSDIKDILPPSKLYDSVKGFLEFLHEYKNVYVKPIAGNRGLGIYNIIQNGAQIEVRTRDNHKNIELIYQNDEEFKVFAEKHITKGKFIVQKTLDIRINNRTADFRIGLDKNQNGEWETNMFITRVSGDHSIVSNVASGGGHVEQPIEALTNIYKMDFDKAKTMKSKLLTVAINIANKIDQTGIELGKLALDLSIDRNHNIYLIEVNNKSPNDNIMKALDDYETFFNIKLKNILYAKGLAGFKAQYYYSLRLNNSTPNKSTNKSRYKITILVSKKWHSAIQQLVEEFCSKSNIVGFIEGNNQINRLVMEVEGDNEKITQLIHVIWNGLEKVKNPVISKVVINVLNKETNFKVVTVTKNLKNKSVDKRTRMLRQDVKKLNSEIKVLQRKNKELQDENIKVKNSRSWRLTAPIRKLFSKVKK